MKKLLLSLSLVAVSFASIQASPIAQDTTIHGAPNGVISSISGTLSSYIDGGVLPYQFNLEGQAVNGTVMLSPIDGSFRFDPTNFPASFQYSVSDANSEKSNTATVNIVSGPTNSTVATEEADLG